MNLITIFNQFPDQQSCINHLEAIRWPEQAFCPLCGSDRVARKVEEGRQGRWNCHKCTSSFNVLSGTVFQKTKIPLQKWFLAIGLMVHAKKSLSSYQLARDLELTQRTAWYMQQRIRAAMANDQGELLQGIIEAEALVHESVFFSVARLNKNRLLSRLSTTFAKKPMLSRPRNRSCPTYRLAYLPSSLVARLAVAPKSCTGYVIGPTMRPGCNSAVV